MRHNIYYVFTVDRLETYQKRGKYFYSFMMSASILLNTSGDAEEEDEPVPELPADETSAGGVEVNNLLTVTESSSSSASSEQKSGDSDDDRGEVDLNDSGQRTRGDDGVLEGVAIGGGDESGEEPSGDGDAFSSSDDDDAEAGIVVHCVRKDKQQQEGGGRRSSSRFSFGK